jgi:hypothetical protein
MYYKKFITDVKDIKSKDTNKILTETTKGTLVGAAIGAGFGILIGIGRGKNLLISGFIGSVIGGGISRIFLTKK